MHWGVLDSPLRCVGATWGEALFGQRSRHEKRAGAAHGLDECQWLQFLHAVGLLRAAFRPEGDICAVRCLMRHRTELVEMTSQHIQHMHKALTQMNVQIQHVISDITGLTGLAIVDRMIEGERDPAVLAKLRDPRIKASEETIRKSLEGNWRAEHLFTLKQSRNSFRHYQEKIAVCEEEIEKLLVAFPPRVDPEQRPLPPDRKAPTA